MSPPVRPAESLRWQLLTSTLETRARWSAHCARIVGRSHRLHTEVPPATPAADATTAVYPTLTLH